MSIIIEGVELPDDFVIAQEERQIVYFVGAGVSCNAGLPSASELLSLIEEQFGIKNKNKNNTKENDDTKVEYKNPLLEKGYEFYYENLERNNSQLKTVIKTILVDNITKEMTQCLPLHTALLNLSCDIDGKIRIVTTNFDDLFQRALEKTEKTRVPTYAAPLLPILKDDWSGIVHLHGKFPSKRKAKEINPQTSTIVLTASDYGSAYMTDGYAVRFLIELFRRYTVCFVGYSGNENIIKYILSAIAADSSSHKFSNDIFAFSPYENEIEKMELKEHWEEYNITPIFIPNFDGKFTNFVSFFNKWSNLNENTRKSKIEIAQNEIKKGEDANLKLLSWALCDEYVAQNILGNREACFKELHFVKHLLNLDINDNREKYVSALSEILQSKEYPSSLFQCSSHFLFNLERKCLIKSKHGVAMVFSRWLSRFIKEEEFLKIIVNFYPFISVQFLHDLEESFYTVSWDKEERDIELLWKYIFTNASKDKIIIENYSPFKIIDNFLMGDFLKNGETVAKHWALKKLLTLLYKPIIDENSKKCRAFWLDKGELTEEELESLNDNKLELKWAIDFPQSYYPKYHFIRYLRENLTVEKIPAIWLKDFENVLLELSKRIDQNPWSRQDLFFYNIFRDFRSKHSKNKWVFVVNLLYQSWESQQEASETEAQKIIYRWMDLQYPIFYFIIFKVITTSSIISIKQCIKWLTKDDCKILLDLNLYEETCNFFKLRGEELLAQETDINNLIKAIVSTYEKFKEKNSIITTDIMAYLNKLKRLWKDKFPQELDQLLLNYPETPFNYDHLQPKIEVGMLHGISNFKDYTQHTDEEFIEYFAVPKYYDVDDVNWERKERHYSQEREWDNFVQCSNREKLIFKILKICKDKHLLNAYRTICLQKYVKKKNARKFWKYLYTVDINELKDIVDVVLRWMYKFINLESNLDSDIEKILEFLENIYFIVKNEMVVVSKIETTSNVIMYLNRDLSLVVQNLLLLHSKKGKRKQINQQIFSLLDKIISPDCKNITGRGELFRNLNYLFKRKTRDWANKNILPLLDWKDECIEKYYYWRCLLSNTFNFKTISVFMEDFLKTFEKLQPYHEERKNYLLFLHLQYLNTSQPQIQTCCTNKIKHILENATYSNIFISNLTSTLKSRRKMQQKNQIKTLFNKTFSINVYEKVNLRTAFNFVICFNDEIGEILQIFLKNKLINYEMPLSSLCVPNTKYWKGIKKLKQKAPEILFDFILDAYNNNSLGFGSRLDVICTSFYEACKSNKKLKYRKGFEELDDFFKST